MKLYIVLPCMVMALLSITHSASGQEAQDSLPPQVAEVIKVKVKGITCAMDLKMIGSSVEELQGVEQALVVKEGPTSTIEVTYAPGRVKPDEIYKAIEGTGGCENPDARPYKVKR